ncbi:MAG: antitoxin [Solobacterium sp.]|jgi:hypothetical protein|nr:antitoxin [Solobacterium sp.]MCH4222714.1 antitoxin [Solobacterium sp.]MCH4265599.1 antitoxin [Solobacterium sp.]
MKPIDEDGLILCKIQGRIFEQSLERVACSSPIFLRRFMFSEIASRMDRPGFLDTGISDNGIFEELSEEYPDTSYGKVKYSREEMYWIGYLYRYWSYTHETTSKHLYRIVKPQELREVYYPYHSLDPAQAIERMIESKGIQEEDYIARGKKIMKKIWQERGLI